MTGEETPALEPFHCSHCEDLGEITYSSYQKQQQNVDFKVWVNNLPAGISQSGIKNLFLTVGKPLSIGYNPRSNSALVTFRLINEAELAVRDLHCQPPYYLNVTFNTQSKKKNGRKPEEVWDFSQQEAADPATESKMEDLSEAVQGVTDFVKKVIGDLRYDPSIRMRQRKLDFKTEVECVSFGRGYMHRGKTDYYVGGLEKFEMASENSKAKNEMVFYCENCKALTTKMCGRCFACYCSKECLRNSRVDHLKDCADVSSGDGDGVCNVKKLGNSAYGDFPDQIPLKSGCTVTIPSYFTMRTVAVRLSDESWEEKFSRVCNDVAAEAFKGGALQEPPDEGDLVLARYARDLCYYRARVISVHGEKITLVFIDFGNVQETDVKDLKPFPEYLKPVPDLAVKVHLKGVSDDSSLDSVDYYNRLTADRVALILDFDKATGEVVLTEKDSKVVVNEKVADLMTPSWKKDESVLSKSGEVLYLNSMEREKLEIGSTYSLVVSHFDEKEFLESNVFWATNPETDNFFHVNSQLYLNMREYCEYLKDDFYLPRVNELCLAKEEGEWRRCVNLTSQKTTCCLFFLDDGHSSLVGTGDIRKMLAEFAEAPSQAICCTLAYDPKMKTNEELRSKAVRYLKESAGQTIESVSVLKLMGDAYCLSVPEIDRILTS